MSVNQSDRSLTAKNILITGGTGSLGTALVERLLSGRHGLPAAINILSRDEFKQFHLRRHLERKYAGIPCRLHFRLGDIRDISAVQQAVRAADVVFHAAALKQVPQCEFNPIEAVQTNVMGLINLVRAAAFRASPVDAVIAASTDKACHPINVLGMTKGLQERILVAAGADSPGTRFMSARYGNVLASRGSVIETFREQIAEGGPITLTSRAMTRFAVTLDDAVDVLISLYRFGRHGEIFVPQAPGMRIETLAECLIGNRNVPIIETGLRPGEKIHESLVNEDELPLTSARDGYYVLAPMFEAPDHSNRSPLDQPFCSNQQLLDHAAVEHLLRRNGLLVSPADASTTADVVAPLKRPEVMKRLPLGVASAQKSAHGERSA
jgi:FlaA1/EpsC-like NDP-sugar epimerase